MAAYSNQACLPAAVPVACELPCSALAARGQRRLPDGADAWRLLPWLLLVPDGVAVLRWGDESVVDRWSCCVRSDGEAAPYGTLAKLRHRVDFDCFRRLADL